MAKLVKFDLQPDEKGLLWDILLYVPTVFFLLYFGGIEWFRHEHNISYVLVFLGTFFFLAGVNRMLRIRMMALPSSPVHIEVDGDEEMVVVELRSGARIDLVKTIKLYGDYAGKSFGLTGLDRQGNRMQYVFARGQFEDDAQYRAAQDAIKRLEKPAAQA